MDRAFAHTGFFNTEAAEALADKLIANAPEGIDRVYLLSVLEAVEAVIKLARHNALETGQPGLAPPGSAGGGR
ncbi:MAG: hypothetical protein ACE368_14825 [Paracoccaceae bacterium]